MTSADSVGPVAEATAATTTAPVANATTAKTQFLTRMCVHSFR
jgi:hypothetical protein